MAIAKLLRTGAWMVWLALLATGCQKQPATKPLVEIMTLDPTDDNPFGGSVAYSLTRLLFSDLSLAENKRSFDRWQNQLTRTDDPHVYLLVAPKLLAYEKEAKAMQQFVEDGNTLLIVTDEINEEWAAAFSIRFFNSDAFESYGPTGLLKDTWIQMADTSAFAPKRFGYFYYPLIRKISASSQYESVKVLALNENNEPSALRLRMGRGQLLVSTNARSFSNYFLLHQQNSQYIQQLLAYVPAHPASITWDHFYSLLPYRQPEGQSILSVLLDNPALKWAFYLALWLAALWVLGNLRRKQKMIPVLSPNTNSTVSFVQTIAQLYFNKSDHALMARKMTAHFLDHLRTHYYLPTQIAGTDWPGLLQHKTGIQLAQARHLHQLMQKAQNDNSQFSATELLHMHWLIKEAMAIKKAPV